MDYGLYFREFLQLGASATDAKLTSAKVRSAFPRLHPILADVGAIACPSGGGPAFPFTRETQDGSMTAFNAYATAFLAASNPPRKMGMVFTLPSDSSKVVRKRGFEPRRYCYRQPLKLVRLPVPPLPQ
jgi:hypothetical protein